MITFLGRVFSINRYGNRAQQDHARLIYGFTLVMMVFFTGFAAFVPLGRSGETAFQQISTNFSYLLAIVSILGLGLITLILTRIGRSDISAVGPIIMWYLSGVIISFGDGFAYGEGGASLMVLILISSLFMRVRGLVIGLAVALVTLLIAALNYTGTIVPNSIHTTTIFAVAVELIGMASLIYLFLRSVRLDRVLSTSKAYEERMTLANVTTQIAQRIQRRTALNELLSSAIEEIRQSYSDIYHVQIFLINEQTREAALVSSTGEVGQTLLKRHHSLAVGSRSVIGQVTAVGESIIARAGAIDGVHRRNEFLPDTAVEAAFPLKINDVVIGALDLQSRLIDAFASEDTPIFQSLADSIAVAIDNARLFEQTEERLQENQRLLEQQRGAVREVERLNSELTQQVWSQYLANNSGELSVDIDFHNSVVRRGNDWTPTLSEAVEFNHVVQKPTRDGVIVSTPLRVRSQVIGAMEFELEGEALTPEDVDLVQAVAERFGLAVESTRLYEESRRVAQRETTLNDIGSRLQRSNTVDAVLSEAAHGLQTSLGASRVTIRLGAPPKGNGNGGEL